MDGVGKVLKHLNIAATIFDTKVVRSVSIDTPLNLFSKILKTVKFRKFILKIT